MTPKPFNSFVQQVASSIVLVLLISCMNQPTQDVVKTTVTANVPVPTSIITIANPALGMNDTPPFQLQSGFPGPSPDPSGLPTDEVADFDIAVGQESILATSNYGTSLLLKDGTLLDFKDNLSMFLPVLENRYSKPINDVGEVRALYDPLSSRFFLAASAQHNPCSEHECISDFTLAVSKSPSPQTLNTSDWHLYTFEGLKFANDGLARKVDFTEITLNSEVVAITSQMALDFEIEGEQGGTAKIIFLPKSDLLAGHQPEQWNTLFDIPNLLNPNMSMDIVEPVILLDDSPRLYFLFWIGGNCSMNVMSVDDPLGTPFVNQNLAVAGGDCPLPADTSPQPWDATPIRTLASPLGSRPVYRNGSIWGVSSVLLPGSSAGISAIRWFQLDLTQWPESVGYVQDGIYGIGGLSLYYPALTVNKNNDVLIFFGASGTETYPSLFLTGRQVGDPLNTLKPSVLVQKGNAPWTKISRNSNRFGDYFSAASDPVDGSAWVFGQYVVNPCFWGSWISRSDWSVMSDIEYQEMFVADFLRPPSNCGR